MKGTRQLQTIQNALSLTCPRTPMMPLGWLGNQIEIIPFVHSSLTMIFLMIRESFGELFYDLLTEYLITSGFSAYYLLLTVHTPCIGSCGVSSKSRACCLSSRNVHPAT
jgi:hypothetical protein